MKETQPVAPVLRMLPHANAVLRDGRQHSMTPRSFAVLQLLVARAGEVVGTKELLERFWRGEVTTKNAVHKAITEIREALGGEPIQTVPKRGYRLIVPIRQGALPALALLPLRDRTGEQAGADWAAGCSDALGHMLGVTGEFELVSGQSAADFVLNGSIDSDAAGLFLCARVERVSDGVRVYEETLRLDAPAAASAQDEVARDVAQALTVHLNDARLADMVARGTRNVRAYLAALEADYLYQLANTDALQRAIERLRHAIALDSGFLMAYVRLAASLRFLRWYSPDRDERLLEELDRLVATLRERVPDAPETAMVMATRNCVAGNIAEQEADLHRLIASGEQSSRAYTAYARLLAGARLADAAALYLQHAQALAPDEIVWVREAPELVLIRDGVEPSLELRRAYLAHDPGDVAHLSALVMQPAKFGRVAEAEAHLRQMRRHDKLNVWSRTTDYFMRAILGRMPLGSAVLNEFLLDKRWFGLVQGQVMFILGEVEAGVKNWRTMTGNEMNVLSINLASMEILFADGVVEDPRYQAMLNDIGLGSEWREFMRGRVESLTSVTGLRVVSPSLPERQANRS